MNIITNPTLSHNPYFNRWFSAILHISGRCGLGVVTILILIDGFLQYLKGEQRVVTKNGHNPYFNRWFSAIIKTTILSPITGRSQSLF